MSEPTPLTFGLPGAREIRLAVRFLLTGALAAPAEIKASLKLYGPYCSSSDLSN